MTFHGIFIVYCYILTCIYCEDADFLGLDISSFFKIEQICVNKAANS